MRLMMIAGFAALLAALWWLCKRATPHKGFMRVIESLCSGVIVCWLCAMLLKPFGISIATGPFGAAAAGLLGLPGAALAVFAQLWR